MYLLTGWARATTMCPVHLANTNHQSIMVLSSVPVPAPVPQQIEHVVLCSQPVTGNAVLLQWWERENRQKGGDKWSSTHTHTLLHAHADTDKKKAAPPHPHVGKYTNTSTRWPATTRMPLIFKHSRTSVGLVSFPVLPPAFCLVVSTFSLLLEYSPRRLPLCGWAFRAEVIFSLSLSFPHVISTVKYPREIEVDNVCKSKLLYVILLFIPLFHGNRFDSSLSLSLIRKSPSYIINLNNLQIFHPRPETWWKTSKKTSHELNLNGDVWQMPAYTDSLHQLSSISHNICFYFNWLITAAPLLIQ